MTDKPDNPQAFPIQGLTNLPNDQLVWPEPGMTLLDWMAGMALQGYFASEAASVNPPAGTAETCYAYAEAMLVERARRLP